MEKKLELTDEVHEWIRKAEEDNRAANHLLRRRSSPTYNIICFCAQQCAEKYLKAYLTAAGKRFPYRHQLEKLLLPLYIEVDPSFQFIEELVRVLDAYSVDYRYPGEGANAQQARRAIKAARNIRRVVRAKLGI